MCYIYNVFIQTYPWQKPIKILRALYCRIINITISYGFFLTSIAWDYFLIVVFLIFDIIYRTQNKNQVFYKTQYKLIQFQPYTYMFWNTAYLYVKSLPSLVRVYVCICLYLL